MANIPQRNPITPPVNVIPGDRALEQREQDSRKYEYRPPGQLPRVKSHPDWTARWCRFRIKAGMDDPGNMGKHRRDQYEPVKFEHREEVLEDPDTVFPDPSGNVVIGDLMLCRRASFVSKARKQYYEDLTKRQLQGAQSNVKRNELAQSVDARHGNVQQHVTSDFRSGRTVEFSDDLG